MERLQSEGNNCVMLQTINFTEDYGQLASNLPKPKYVKRRNKSTETLEKTRSKVTSESSDARSGKKTSVIKRKYDGSSSLQKLKIKENN